ncbi:WhiB family transcriptional regulator [Nocardioides pelophilus]|uniref:WhiB family transcriptional regulator n=1 Tax=Nocardioides pelophilus TaxID=2172019 RepID=UPI0016011F26|nr:WhiB family transcriptional regulator [Nocardioides pelophilus]
MTARKTTLHEDRFDTKGVTIAFTAPTPQDPTLAWACADHPDPDLFHPTDDADLAAARAICAGCPVRELCLELGLRRDEYGVWGGVLLENGQPRSGVPRKGRPPKVGSAA